MCCAQVEPKFAHFFLAHLRGPYNYLNTWHDLATLDAELHKNLMFLKTYTGDAADLSLAFTVADDTGLGAQGAEVELVSGGAHLEVREQKKRAVGEHKKQYRRKTEKDKEQKHLRA